MFSERLFSGADLSADEARDAQQELDATRESLEQLDAILTQAVRERGVTHRYSYAIVARTMGI